MLETTIYTPEDAAQEAELLQRIAKRRARIRDGHPTERDYSAAERGLATLAVIEQAIKSNNLNLIQAYIRGEIDPRQVDTRAISIKP